MLFEYMEYGDLADLLRKNDPALSKDNPVELKEVSVSEGDTVPFGTLLL